MYFCGTPANFLVGGFKKIRKCALYQLNTAFYSRRQSCRRAAHGPTALSRGRAQHGSGCDMYDKEAAEALRCTRRLVTRMRRMPRSADKGRRPATPGRRERRGARIDSAHESATAVPWRPSRPAWRSRWGNAAKEDDTFRGFSAGATQVYGDGGLFPEIPAVVKMLIAGAHATLKKLTEWRER